MGEYDYSHGVGLWELDELKREAREDFIKRKNEEREEYYNNKYKNEVNKMSENQKTNVVKYKDFKGNEIKLSPQIIKQYLVSGNKPVTNEEAIMFLMICKSQNLNPFIKDAYLIKYSDKATIVVGKDVFVRRATSNPDFSGMVAGIIIEKNNELIYREGALLLSGEKIVGGWAEVNRKSWNKPIRAEVSWGEYAGKTKDGQLTNSWAKMGATMIRKVALVQALREAFSEMFSGLYDSAEMSQANDDVDVVDVTENTNQVSFVETDTDNDNLYGDDGIDKLLKDDEPLPSPLGVTNE